MPGLRVPGPGAEDHTEAWCSVMAARRNDNSRSTVLCPMNMDVAIGSRRSETLHSMSVCCCCQQIIDKTSHTQ